MVSRPLASVLWAESVQPRLEYPFGTVFEVEGHGEWVVQDRGGAIKGDKLDLLMDSHGKAILFGVQYLKVRKVE